MLNMVNPDNTPPVCLSFRGQDVDQRHVDVSTTGAVGGCQESCQGAARVSKELPERMWIYRSIPGLDFEDHFQIPGD